VSDQGFAERVERIEAHLAIQQLAIRYAIAVDSRDIDAWVGCFRPDVDMGRHGTGRDALRRYIDPMVRRFYRSVHQICGHRIDLAVPDRPVPDLAVPDLAVPDLAVPDLAVPDLAAHDRGILDRATGAVYCRAEHEVADRWIVIAICYFDDYARVDGEWYFSRRRERHWYAADVTQRPQSAGFAGWEGSGEPGLPGEFPSWARFWAGDGRVTALTGAA